MSSVQAMRDDLQRLEEAAEAARAHTASRGMRLALRGVDEMHGRIERDIELALRPALDVVLDGAPVVGHEIRVDALSKVLHSLQESVSAIAQALTGKATAQASLPGPLREQTALSLSAIFPGSFGATLRGPVDKDLAAMLAQGQEALFDPIEHESLLDRSVDTVLEIVTLASSENVDDEPIVEAVLPLGSRAYKHLLDLSSAIVDQNLSARIEWKHLGAEPREVFLTRPTARRLDDVLRMNKMSERATTIVGRLGTVSDIRNRVEIQLDEERVISAKVADEVVPTLAEYFTLRVSADVMVTTIRSAATGKERESFVVTGLATVAQDHRSGEDPAF